MVLTASLLPYPSNVISDVIFLSSPSHQRWNCRQRWWDAQGRCSHREWTHQVRDYGRYRSKTDYSTQLNTVLSGRWDPIWKLLRGLKSWMQLANWWCQEVSIPILTCNCHSWERYGRDGYGECQSRNDCRSQSMISRRAHRQLSLEEPPWWGIL